MTPVPMHLGSLHPMEQALTLVLAFGPFVVLGIVIAVRRRHDRAADEELARQDRASNPQRER
ncbi:hypothetical protein NSZ01_25950 [Nocardioides szechwanensis]|uniref:Uncharacterized protein n=1 Tax=Nocardioides szechwanensis TaxID=1005944 RepID=A0A1H0AKB9_9ACTN|nr:hypothetical protein [Nocardioides szechwanensis]GEP34827.1 hypothetical protein NSZ01_25950 [Nocardioides szechwanensis]SDN33988.1 hypothetical protein SAMN05192576_2066 [Nocardioides szechwanensis]